jgi:4-amino-4-deoxy-L-arabinose transferase-like glycosyltransferase
MRADVEYRALDVSTARKPIMHFGSSLKARQGFIVALALGVILVVGAVLRLHDVEYRTLDHPEAYTPGIDLPWELSNPNPRFTLWQTLAGTIAGDVHPPGYYVVMLGWTKCFGSSIFSLRLPSLLFGVASILLIYFLASYTEDNLTALLAAAMLAANGLHLYWSQAARMYSMACFLGLLSTVLLVLIIKHRHWTYHLLYVVVTVAGLATHVYFWPLFATQALWVFATNLRARSLPGLLRLQIFTFIVATPLVAIAVYQATHRHGQTTLSPLRGVFQFLQLGSLLETDPFTVSTASVDAVASILALLVTALLIFSAALKKKVGELTARQSVGDIGAYERPHFTVTAAVAALTTLSFFGFAYVAKALLPGRSTRSVVAASVLPLALLFLDILVCKYWERFKALRTTLAKKASWLVSLRSLNFFLAVLPVSTVAGISFFKPMFVQRGTLVFLPFLLILLASGLANLIRRDHRWFAIALILAIIHALSVLHSKSQPPIIDYKGLAEQLAPQIEDSDLIFVHGRGHPADWVVAPIFYYLNAGRYHFVGRDFAKAIENHSQARIWTLSFLSVPTEKEAVDALAGHELRKRVDALNILAQLYVAKAPAETVNGELRRTARISE